jgi:phospholipid-translocating ATPase
MNRYIFGSILITLFVYMISLLFLKNYLDTADIDQEFMWKVGAIVGVSWIPVFIFKVIKRKIWPS